MNAGSVSHQGHTSIPELMSTGALDRDRRWLQRALQCAVSLEFFTIPVYLTAMWTVKDPAHRVRALIGQIAQMEMLHMGLACNLLTTLGGTPVVAREDVVPKYPGHLPCDVHPGLIVRLQALSKCLVEHVFMRIEEPDFEPVAHYRGQVYPTIGAFYSAIEVALARLDPGTIKGERQLEYEWSDGTKLGRMVTLADALEAIALIREQGEGTHASPFFGQSEANVAHYYRFGEMLCERRIVRDCMGNWSYSGQSLPFPAPRDIYPMATVPIGGYDTDASHAFDRAYTRLLWKLQLAWERGGDEGQDLLNEAVVEMPGLYPLARVLLETEIGQSGWHYGPSFRVVRGESIATPPHT